MKEKKEKGITLVALVVTIIILLILAGVTLNMAMSRSGLFDRAVNATEKYKIAQEDEKEKLVEIEEKMDLIPPSIPTIALELENGEEYKEGEWTNQNVKITFSALDEGGSGITSYEYSLDGKNSEGVITSGYVIDTEGITNISIRAVDKAGNKGEWSKVKTVKRDTVAPTVTLTGKVNGTTNVTLTGGGTDEVCNISYQWSTSSTAPTTGWNNVDDMSTTQNFNVTTSYYFWVKDEAGNSACKRANISRASGHANGCYTSEKCHTAWQDLGPQPDDDYRSVWRCQNCGKRSYDNQTQLNQFCGTYNKVLKCNINLHNFSYSIS